jgi:hypothetical protein
MVQVTCAARHLQKDQHNVESCTVDFHWNMIWIGVNWIQINLGSNREMHRKIWQSYVHISSDLLKSDVKYQYHNTADGIYCLKSPFLFLLHSKCVCEFHHLTEKSIVEGFQILWYGAMCEHWGFLWITFQHAAAVGRMYCPPTLPRCRGGESGGRLQWRLSFLGRRSGGTLSAPYQFRRTVENTIDLTEVDTAWTNIRDHTSLLFIYLCAVTCSAFFRAVINDLVQDLPQKHTHRCLIFTLYVENVYLLDRNRKFCSTWGSHEGGYKE